MNGKRIVFWSAIAALVAIAGIAIAGAESHRGWCGYHSAHRGWGGPVALGYVTHKLDLNQAQRKQIRSIWDAEKPAVSSLVAEFASEEKEMDQATAGGVLDGGKVQEIAARQGATVSRLLVERAQLESKIYSTVLTPEQRTRADKMKEQWQDRMERMVNHAAVGK
ncbi:MAG TPA: Spy/CpxP family protein refolding chaperone [Acidobacteriaceae bacterium]|nr:Spy/CpxP family protein refolding chaperone [Acidobacteriaceae bacterium]